MPRGHSRVALCAATASAARHPATRPRRRRRRCGGCALDLLVALLILFLFVALGVLGRADLASLGVDACATLSFAFHDFACGFGGHYVSRCDECLWHNTCEW